MELPFLEGFNRLTDVAFGDITWPCQAWGNSTILESFSNLNYDVILSLYKPEHLNCSEHHNQTLVKPSRSPGSAQPKSTHSKHASLPFSSFP